MRTVISKYNLIIFGSVLLMMFSKDIDAQDQDFGLWTGLAIEQKITKRWDIELDGGYRLKDNLIQQDKTFIGTELSWSKRFFEASALYRFSTVLNKNRSINSHRFGFQTQLKKDINRLTFVYRGRIQCDYAEIRSAKTERIPISYFRNRLKTAYNIKGLPLEPFLCYELFWRLNEYTSRQIEKTRLTTGLDYRFNKHHKIGFSWMINDQRNVTDPTKSYIVSIDYKVKL
ncbi:DUF2490 domain-containing protein [Mangrovibacterium lignilyticum]|uniref:DUF2490 domain-containing protein n=1 Tax=Mangrovibacterium lignilyticum TaxID=2668052 RepID=UPI0013D52C24|nr:DUF2490 domain-containing protein [Mangrovibacterium lignilyticum]